MPVSLEKRALSLVGELLGLLDLDELCHGLLHVLRDEIPADWCAIHELPAEMPQTISLTDPPVPVEVHEAFARLAGENPIADHMLRTRRGRATRFSDLITRRQLHELALYREVYRRLGVEYQIAFTLPSGAERILGVALSREHHDFTARERDLLNLARPYLIQIYRNALAHGDGRDRPATPIPLENLQALGLTRRQAEVLALIATGHTAPEAAATLAIATRTAQKHLERCYQTLGTTNRTQASRLAWATVHPG